MDYKTLSNGWINKNQYCDAGDNRPNYIGNVHLDENISSSDNIEIALWERNGSFSFKISKKNN